MKTLGVQKKSNWECTDKKYVRQSYEPFRFAQLGGLVDSSRSHCAQRRTCSSRMRQNSVCFCDSSSSASRSGSTHMSCRIFFSICGNRTNRLPVTSGTTCKPQHSVGYVERWLPVIRVMWTCTYCECDQIQLGLDIRNLDLSLLVPVNRDETTWLTNHLPLPAWYCAAKLSFFFLQRTSRCVDNDNNIIYKAIV